MEELNLHVGYKFSPTELQLLLQYLLNKILGRNLPADIIPTFDCFSCSPNRLPFQNCRYGIANEWHFFTRGGSEGKLVKTTEDGYYQVSKQKQKKQENQLVGSIRRFDFYNGSFPLGIKSEWCIKEFKLDPHLLHTYQQHEQVTTRAMDSNLVACKVLRNVEQHDQSSGAGASLAKRGPWPPIPKDF